MKKKLEIILRPVSILLLLLVVIQSFAQQRHTISGTVRDKKSGETLIGASVILLGQKEAGALTNSYGFYSLTVPQNEYTVVTTFLGFSNDTVRISLTKDVTRSIALAPGDTRLEASVMPQPVSLDSVSYTTGRNNSTINGVVHFNDPSGTANYYQFIEYSHEKKLIITMDGLYLMTAYQMADILLQHWRTRARTLKQETP